MKLAQRLKKIGIWKFVIPRKLIMRGIIKPFRYYDDLGE